MTNPNPYTWPRSRAATPLSAAEADQLSRSLPELASAVIAYRSALTALSDRLAPLYENPSNTSRQRLWLLDRFDEYYWHGRLFLIAGEEENRAIMARVERAVAEVERRVTAPRELEAA